MSPFKAWRVGPGAKPKLEGAPIVVVGADGCKCGWFAVRLDGDGAWDIRVFEDIRALWNVWHDARPILLDVPIGLPDGKKKERQCDVEARSRLGRPRASSVFPPPCRAAFGATSRVGGSQANWQVTGRKLSPFVWGILPKIREVDSLLRENREARVRIREVHPEVCFWAFAGGKPMKFSKKTEKGRQERLKVLRCVDHRTDEIVERAQRHYRRRDVAVDDILDALAAAFTAQCTAVASIPAEAERDAWGLAMEMVYCEQRGHGPALPRD